MRFYSFVNALYMSQVQWGIQTQHCTADMFVRYDHGQLTPQRDTLFTWAKYHKTTIILNGGNCADLQNLNVELQEYTRELQLPNCAFREDVQSLNGALTCVGVVVPEIVYNTAQFLRPGTGWTATVNDNKDEPAPYVLIKNENVLQDGDAVNEFTVCTKQFQLAQLLNRYQLAR